MTKKEVITSILVIGLTLLFAVICIAVFLTKGKSAKWVSRKLKVGGLLLSFTAIVQTGCHRNTLCYKFADPLPEISNAKVKLISTNKSLIKGKLKDIHSVYYFKKGYERWKSEGYDSTILDEEYKPYLSTDKMKKAGPTSFHYEIMKVNSKDVLRYGNLAPKDGKFNSTLKEVFEIRLNNKLQKGKYELKIHYKNLYTLESFEYPNPFKIEIDSKIIKIRK